MGDNECDVTKDGTEKISCKICQKMIGKKGMAQHMKTHLKQNVSRNNTVSMNSVNFSQTSEQSKKDYFFPEQKTRLKETPSVKSNLFNKDSVKDRNDHLNPRQTIQPEDTLSKKGNLVQGPIKKPKTKDASKTFCQHYFFYHEKNKKLTIKIPTKTKIKKAMKMFATEHGFDCRDLEFLTAEKCLLTGDEPAGEVPRGEISVRRKRFVEAEDVNSNIYNGDQDKAVGSDGRVVDTGVMDPLDLSNSWDSDAGRVKRQKVDSGVDTMLGSSDPLDD